MSDTSTELQPPWIVYPDSDPYWGGWRQGYSEAWLVDQWLPFWRALDKGGRLSYLERWPPPSEEWRTYLLVFWK
jgi:hypothetical protein